MSKASEWAAAMAAAIDVHRRRPQFISEGSGAARTTICQVTESGGAELFYGKFTPKTAVALGLWLIDTFGGDA